MIIKEYQLNEVIKKSSYPRFILFFGPNEGLIRENILKISSSFKENIETDEITINGKSLDENHTLLNEEIRSFSMFSEQKIIYLENLKDKHLQYFESEKLENDKILVIMKSDNLTKNSKIRNFFEKHKIFAAIPCYEDDKRSSMNLLSQFQSEHEIKLDSDVKNYLLQNLSSDRLISKNELEKILLVISGKKNQEISLEEIQNIFNDGSSHSLNIINENVMYGKVNQVSKNLYKIFDEGTNAVAIIRSLLNYLVRVHKTQIEIKKLKILMKLLNHLNHQYFGRIKIILKIIV